MASLCFNSLPLRPSQSRKGKPSSSSSECSNGGLKPITVTGTPPTFVSASGRRIVAVGDLHGDLAQTRCALEIAGVLSSDGRDLWIGGETVLVQLGDILDRGEDEIAILSLLHSLNAQAEPNGGAVFQVNGNHESMNVEGDFRFVDPGGFDECIDFLDHLDEYEDDWEDAFIQWISVAERWKEERKMSHNHWGPWNMVKVLIYLFVFSCPFVLISTNVQSFIASVRFMKTLGQRQKGIVARSSLFRPGGPLACELAQHGVVLKVDDWVFCHGGLLPHHVAYGIERMNKEVSQWMQGFPEDNTIPELPFIATRGYDSVVWNRLYSRDSTDGEYQKWQISSIAEKTLQAVGAKGMVVGHTPQFNGINCKYDHRIWCVDVGMSNGVLNSRPEVLEIVDKKARVLRNQVESSQLEIVEYL